MRHRKANKKLNKPTDQRIALLRANSRALLLNNRIELTHRRALETKRYIEKLITISKKNTVQSKRLVLKYLPDKELMNILFNKIAPKYTERNGGYTRVLKCGIRQGDAATISLLEFV